MQVHIYKIAMYTSQQSVAFIKLLSNLALVVGQQLYVLAIDETKWVYKFMHNDLQHAKLWPHMQKPMYHLHTSHLCKIIIGISLCLN